jgi:hypothetical protein
MTHVRHVFQRDQLRAGLRRPRAPQENIWSGEFALRGIEVLAFETLFVSFPNPMMPIPCINTIHHHQSNSLYGR